MSHNPNPGAGRREMALGGFLVLVALALRLWDAAGASLHLDDFHSLHHARAGDLTTFFRVLAQDNHPPLSFLVLRALRSIAGEGEFVLRLPNVLYGTATVALAWRLSRRLGSLTPRVLGTGLLALSSLHLNLSSDLRMYALLGLAVLGIVDAVLDRLCPRPRTTPRDWSAVRLAGWIAVALLTHYHALHAAAVLALAYGALLLSGRTDRAGWRRLWIPVLLGCSIAIPWYATGFRTQLGHELAPGGSQISPTILLEAFAHLIFFRLDPAQSLRPLLAGLGLLSLPLALIGASLLFARARRGNNGWELPAFLSALAFGLPAWTALVAWLQPRAGFEWRYLAASIAPYCLLVGSATARATTHAWPLLRTRRALVALTLLGASILSVAHALDRGREDYRSAAEYILENAAPGDGVLGVEWQPRLFPRGGGWRYYAEQLGHGREEGLIFLDHTPDFRLLQGDPGQAPRLEELPRVFCLLRSIPDDVPLLRRLRVLFEHEHKARFGEGIWVLTFAR